MQTQTKWRCAIVCIFAVLVLWASMRASSPSSTSSASEAFDEASDSTTAKAGFTIVERGQPADGAPVILAPHAENRASSDDERIVNVQPSTPAPVIDERSADIVLLGTYNNIQVMLMRSSDAGAHWTAPQDITAQIKSPDWQWYATGPVHGIQIKQGQFKGRQ